MARSETSRFQVEWFNVTYRSVFTLVTLVVLALGGGGGYWYYFHVHVPRVAASDALGRAESRFGEASSLESASERLGEVVASARVALSEARGAFGNMRFDEARAAAIRSENLSLQAIGMVKGDGANSERVRFYRLEGDVRVKKAGQFAWEAADHRMELNQGDQIKTSSSASAQVIFFDGTITTVRPGSLYLIREVSENPGTKVRRVREELTFGEINASTQDQNVEGSYHEVAAGEISARSQQAAEFRIRAEEGRVGAEFDVFQGQIEVAARGRRESVAAGERIRAGSDGRLRDKELLPGVPALVAPRDQRVFVLDTQAPEPIALTWDAVPGAARYHLMISDQPLFTDPLYDDKRDTPRAVIGEVAEGSYHWRVAAIAPSGAEGPFSSPRRFRVSGQKIVDRTDSEPPALEISEFVSFGPMVVVNGKTEPGANLWVDTEKVDVFENGQFSTVVRLRREGLNEVRFVAQDSAGNETELVRKTYVELY